jgi:hypothetical protein
MVLYIDYLILNPLLFNINTTLSFPMYYLATCFLHYLPLSLITSVYLPLDYSDI